MSDVINGVPRELLERVLSVMDNYVTHETREEDQLRALLTAQPQASALTGAAPGCFVQPVPSHCDRITWRGNYYQLPDGLTQASAAQSAQEKCVLGGTGISASIRGAMEEAAQDQGEVQRLREAVSALADIAHEHRHELMQQRFSDNDEGDAFARHRDSRVGRIDRILQAALAASTGQEVKP